jgi:hypothetical protein
MVGSIDAQEHAMETKLATRLGMWAALCALPWLLSACNLEDSATGQSFKAGDACSREGDRRSGLECQDGRWRRVEATPDMMNPSDMDNDHDLSADQPIEDQGVEEDLGCQAESDAQLCAGVNADACGELSVTDRCGSSRALSCGGCDAAQHRECQDNKCICVQETDEELCGAAGRQCGLATLTDRCGVERSVDCGGCDQGTCGDDGACSVCQPETNAQLCARVGAQCGSVSAEDNCGLARVVESCGLCRNLAETCSRSNQCVCVAETDAQLCARLGAACGSVAASDNCGQMRLVAECGTCISPSCCDDNSNICRSGRFCAVLEPVDPAPGDSCGGTCLGNCCNGLCQLAPCP